MKKLKDLCLSVLLNEGEEVFSLSPSEVGAVKDASISGDDFVISFDTSYGKPANLIVKSSDFQKWAADNKGKFKDMFKYFIIDFLSKSSEGEASLNEIVDDDGNIMPDEDMPSNATNSMVVGPKFDLEKIYKSFVPKSIRFYSGDLGLGIITW